jgi:hypothetical protein
VDDQEERMKRLPVLLLIALLLPAAAGAGNWHIISEDDAGITIEFVTGSPVIMTGGKMVRIPGFTQERVPGLPVLPVKRFLIEVPADRGIRLQVLGSTAVPVEGVVPEVWPGGEAAPAAPRDFAVLASVETMRKRRLALVDIYPVIANMENGSLLHSERITIRLSWAPSRPVSGKRAVPGPEDRYVIGTGRWTGSDEIPALAAPGERTTFEFALSDKWLKLTMQGTGLYRISYEDLTRAGVNPQTIDPASVRIFTTGPLQQPDSIRHGGSFEEDYHLTEVELHYSGANTGSMMPGEYFIYYGLGIRGWNDHLDPSTEDIRFYKHMYFDNSVYWMSWGGSFEGQPARVQSRVVAPTGSTDLDVNTYSHRIHVEQDVLYDPIHTDDYWYWRRLNEGTTLFEEKFQCVDIAGGGGMVRTLGYGPYIYNNNQNEADCYVNEEHAGHMSWIVYSDFRPDTVETAVSSIVEGENKFRLIKTSEDVMYVLWFDLFYNRYLKALDGRLDFFSPSGAMSTAAITMNGFPTTGEIFLFDVTDHAGPVRLTGWQNTLGEIVFEEVLDAVPRHYHASTVASIRTPSITIESMAPGVFPSLRDETPPDMIIVYHRNFQEAANRLAAYRRNNLPYSDNPVVRAVDIEDVYNNFSGGMKDPLAVRNYLKFLYDTFSDGGAPVIDYALLIGNCTYDSRNILGRSSDFVPVYINVNYEDQGVEDDDFLVKLDSGYDRMIDVAIGRMPVLTRRDADLWVDRVIRYESDIDMGTWRNSVIVVADDENSTNTNNDFYFTWDAEWMTADDGPIPGFVDYTKVYLNNYPFVGDLKPGATSDLIEAWSRGALVVNYAGHGSPQQLSDERVLQMSDLYSFTNGDKQPLFLAFSCTVGDLESPFHRSMGQEITVLEEGGAIAVIAGVAPTILIPNRELNYIYFDYLFTGGDSTSTEPVGTALMMAKTDYTIFMYTSNNAKYILLGDPALTLSLPNRMVEHDIAAIDTMGTGGRYTLRGRVTEGGELLSTFNGTAEIVVQESMEMISKDVIHWGNPAKLDYRLPGNDIFRGSVDVTAGRFDLDFVIPVRCRTGPRARVRSYVSEAGDDGIGAADTLAIVTSGTLPPNEGPPDIDIYFSGQATKVKQGAILVADMADSDGIAILGTEPQNSIYLEFDRSGYPIFVTEYFEYEHGSSTTGRVDYPLHSGFEPGEHSVIVRAFDNLGESATDTLFFEVVEEGLYTVSDVFNMPNPFTESTNFVFQLSSRADVLLRVYNLSGIEIWNARLAAEEGFNSIYWEGRDFIGDQVANGTYIYVLEVSFRDSFNRSETVRGKVVHLR